MTENSQNKNIKKVIASSESFINTGTQDPLNKLDTPIVFTINKGSSIDNPIDDDNVSKENLANSSYGLLDKFLQGKIPLRTHAVILLLILIWFAIICWLFIQDNDAGKLENIKGIMWFGAKTGFLTIILIVVSFAVKIISHFFYTKE